MGMTASVRGLVAFLALAVTVVGFLSYHGAGRTELMGLPEPTLPQSKAARQHMFNYLATESWTPPDETKYLATRFGLPAPMQTQNLRGMPGAAGDANVNSNDKDVQSARNMDPAPYFEEEPTYRRGFGMHAATAQYEYRMRKKGIVDNDGKHFLNAEQGKALANELSNTIADYTGTEDRDPTAPPRGHLNAVQEKQLAEDLRAGERYAFLPDYGKPQAAPGYLQGSQRQQLVHDLVNGQEFAYGDNQGAPQPVRVLDPESALKLASDLEAGQRYADLPNFGRPAAPKPLTDLQQIEKEQQLVSALEQGQAYADLGASNALPLHQLAQRTNMIGSLERRAWGLPRSVNHRPVPLTHAQDRNLARYLNQGIREVFGSREVPEPKYMSKAEANALVKGAEEGAWAEYQANEPPHRRYQSKQEAAQLSSSLSQTLRQYQSGAGPYVTEYLKSVEGNKFSSPAEMSRERQEAKNRALADTLSAGLKYVQEAQDVQNNAPVASHMLTAKEGSELAAYLTPQANVVQGQAPALGYAV